MGLFKQYMEPDSFRFTCVGGASRQFNAYLSNWFLCRFYKAGTTNVVAENGAIIALPSGDNTIVFDCAHYDYVTGLEMDNQGIKGNYNVSKFKKLNSFRLGSNSNLTGITHANESGIFTTYQAPYCNLIGNLDLSGLNGLGGTFSVHTNPNLTSITNPTSTNIFSAYHAYNCNLTGHVNLSTLSQLGGEVRLDGNSGLTQIILPSNNRTIQIYAYSCDLTGNIDWSGLSGVTDFNVRVNPNLTGITHPNSSKVMSLYQAYSCNLIGNLDVSSLSGLGGQFIVNTNPNLTGITNPISSQDINYYWSYSCDLSSIDLSTFSSFGGDFKIYSNSNLTGITHPNSTRTFSIYYAYSCNLDYIDFTKFPNMTNVNSCGIRLDNNGMGVSDVNHILADLDSISSAGYSSRVINIGGTNATPDGSSGGYDGTGATTSLVAKSFTVTTS